MIKLIASDLDGTLLQNGSRKVPEEFFETIKECKKAGFFLQQPAEDSITACENCFRVWKMILRIFVRTELLPFIRVRSSIG